ncbi:MAG: sugar transferase [Bacillota bacterium]|nr:sugar transferase [Bacillota bacterium]
MKKNEIVTGLYEIGVYFVDMLIVMLSIYASFIIKFNFNFNLPKFNFQAFEISFPFILITYLVFMYVFGLVDIFKHSLGETLYSLFLTVIMLFVTTMAITFFMRAFSYPRSVILMSTVIQFVVLAGWRTFVWKLKRYFHGSKVVIVIGGESAERLAKKILTKKNDLYKLKYVCSEKSSRLWEFLKSSEVVFMSEEVEQKIKDEVVTRCLDEKKSLFILPSLYDIGIMNAKLEKVDDIPVLEVKKIGLTIEEETVKRIIDIVLSAIGIVIATPVMLIISILIKCFDGGEVFYLQERVTENERTFKIIKFRTMVKNAEKLTGPVIAGEDDPRITPIGKFIRATRIDELPQLFNILIGDMSIVGPRPERPFFVEKFKDENPDYKYRTIVKAGLTGLAQVLGKYNTTAEDKLRYDVLYIKNYSVLLDLKLILQTVKIMFMKESTEGLKEDASFKKIVDKYGSEVIVDR